MQTVRIRDATENVIEFWVKQIGIPADRFTNTFYQHTKWKKEFSDTNYHGVVRIHVKKSLENLLRMRGWIEGLKSSMPG